MLGPPYIPIIPLLHGRGPPKQHSFVRFLGTYMNWDQMRIISLTFSHGNGKGEQGG